MPAYIKIGDIKGEAMADHFEFKSDAKSESNGTTEVEWTYAKGGTNSEPPPVVLSMNYETIDPSYDESDGPKHELREHVSLCYGKIEQDIGDFIM